jgi:predicted metal-dependent HD superfamily phosphohydrolase
MNFEKLKDDIIKKLSDELPGDLLYHNVEHSEKVLAAAERIATSEGISGEDLILLKTAAVLHDCGFLRQYTNNEPVGCRIAMDILPDYGYSKEQIDKICALILATAIPQKPENKLSEILCDADLDYLGCDEFFPIADSLRKELESNMGKFTDADWLRFELDFLKQHNYFTETQRKNREPKKQKIINQLEDMLKKLEG